MRRALVVLAGCLIASASGQGAGGNPPFRGTFAPLSPALRALMTGVSWRPGCPVGLTDLRLVTVRHVDFAGRTRTGRLVVHKDHAARVVATMRKLYDARFPIRRMRLIDAYGGSDFRSIEADNTSAFNCRRATGSSNWSEHAYGRAIDVNPIENPYVEGSRVYHAASRAYVARRPVRRGMAADGGQLVRAFDAIGWGWGGRWSGTVKDYQHFSASGR
jgi:D-alanyl-D-alanine carboxypeptidase-like protein